MSDGKEIEPATSSMAFSLAGEDCENELQEKSLLSHRTSRGPPFTVHERGGHAGHARQSRAFPPEGLEVPNLFVYIAGFLL